METSLTASGLLQALADARRLDRNPTRVRANARAVEQLKDSLAVTGAVPYQQDATTRLFGVEIVVDQDVDGWELEETTP